MASQSRVYSAMRCVERCCLLQPAARRDFGFVKELGGIDDTLNVGNDSIQISQTLNPTPQTL